MAAEAASAKTRLPPHSARNDARRVRAPRMSGCQMLLTTLAATEPRAHPTRRCAKVRCADDVAMSGSGRGRVKTQGCLDEEVSYTEATGFFGAAVYEAIHRRRGTNPGDVAAGVSGGLR